MNTFPLLNTGAITQYPAKAGTSFSNQVLQFVDGSEQRFPGYGGPQHQWTVQLDLLGEDEMSRLAAFFADLAGPAGSFVFTDPDTDTVYPDCSFGNEEFSMVEQPGSVAKTTLTIRENKS
jgi:hypothetical protein